MTIKPLGDENGQVEFELSTTGQWGAIGFNNEKNKMVRNGLILVMLEKLTFLVGRPSAGYFIDCNIEGHVCWSGMTEIYDRIPFSFFSNVCNDLAEPTYFWSRVM